MTMRSNGVENHWGIWVNSDIPVTGVFSGNDLAWEFLDNDFIDVAYEEALQELTDSGMDEDEIEAEMEYWETGDTQLYGDWIEKDGQYVPDYDNESEDAYALIYNSNENTVQVLFSKRIKFGRMASPCYPGQVDARTDDPDTMDTVHVQKYYSLPDWAIGENR